MANPGQLRPIRSYALEGQGVLEAAGIRICRGSAFATANRCRLVQAIYTYGVGCEVSNL